MQETQETSLSQEDPLEEYMETHFIVLAWRISWRDEPGGLQSWVHKESDMIEEVTHTCAIRDQYMMLNI